MQGLSWPPSGPFLMENLQMVTECNYEKRVKKKKKYLVPRGSQPDCWFQYRWSRRSDRLQNHCAPVGEWKQGYCLRSRHPRGSNHPTCTQIKRGRYFSVLYIRGKKHKRHTHVIASCSSVLLKRLFMTYNDITALLVLSSCCNYL